MSGRGAAWRRGRRLAGLLLALVLLPGAAAQGEGAASAVVEGLHQALADSMAAGDARSFRQRVAALEPVVLSVFDFSTITRLALGRAWDGLAPAQRQRFQELMQRLSVNTYASNFASRQHAERFVTVMEQPGRRARVLVRTRLERDDGDPVTLDYVLHDTSDGLRIINVLAEGVSDLSLKRAQFAAVIRDHGVEELIRRLEAQVADLAPGDGGKS